MASLTETAIVTRKAIRWGIYGVFLLIVGRIVIGVGLSLYRRANPPPPPAPTVGHGRLPKIDFPEREDYKFTYRLETPTGDLSEFPTQSRVYYMARSSVHFFSYDQAQKRAQALGFTGAEQKVSDTVYKFFVGETLSGIR